jgi:Flp pilus assembly pilin Flp
MKAHSLAMKLALAQQSCRRLLLDQRILRDQRGQDLVEYALLVGFVTIAAWAFFPTDIFPSASTIFQKFTDLLSQIT